ncbi:TAFII55 protein conserved region-domain-containing protein [Sphaerosporella brunnea]|uniref:TAFII55 protein conserved region-domain-containing protein n=1 Tax=Sphaerosporella brunnea TaxID=1250544 RepID=A0A5J5F1L1_9PEZI|nr:TAFII55 protein conserved region-domain-containing protein [Sphaerosporella brunnea]
MSATSDSDGSPQLPYIKIKCAAFPSQPAAPAPPLSSIKLNVNPSLVAEATDPQVAPAPPPKSASTKRWFASEPGTAYDSGASDREEEPVLEENFILRMIPGDDCDYLRNIIERGELNLWSDVWMRFKDPKKAVLSIRGNLYAAILVDLPCIIESQKTLDKKNFLKVADICQMLMVTQRIPNEDALWSVKFDVPDQFPDGLTPPMQCARKRFKKRVSPRTVHQVEAEVARLLREDELAESSTYSWEYEEVDDEDLVDTDTEEDLDPDPSST